MAVPCPAELRHKRKSPGPNSRMQGKISSSHTFIFLPVIPTNCSSISAPALCCSQSQDQAWDSFSARNRGFRVAGGCWEREALWHGLAAASHWPLTPLLPSPWISLPRCDHPGALGDVGLGFFHSYFYFFGLWQLTLPSCPPQPAEREVGCNLRELLCSGRCGSGKTLEYLICNQQFPGLRTSGRERLGFILLKPLEVLKQDLCCLFAGFIFP